MFYSEANTRLGMNLVFIDYLKNFPMPGFLSTPTEVPMWNEVPEDEAIQVVFAFAAKYLQDHSYVIAFHS